MYTILIVFAGFFYIDLYTILIVFAGFFFSFRCTLSWLYLLGCFLFRCILSWLYLLVCSFYSGAHYLDCNLYLLGGGGYLGVHYLDCICWGVFYSGVHYLDCICWDVFFIQVYTILIVFDGVYSFRWWTRTACRCLMCSTRRRGSSSARTQSQRWSTERCWVGFVQVALIHSSMSECSAVW